MLFQLAKEETPDSEDEHAMASGAARVPVAAQPADNSADSEHDRDASQRAEEEAPDREDEPIAVQPQEEDQPSTS